MLFFSLFFLVILVSSLIEGQDHQFLIAGHRGAAGVYPAHTVPAYQEGAQFSDLIECDIAVTNDLKLIKTCLQIVKRVEKNDN